eukprot:39520_1
MSFSLRLYCGLLYVILFLLDINVSSNMQLNYDDDTPNTELSLSILQNSCIGKKDGYYYLKLSDKHSISSFVDTLGHTEAQEFRTKKYPIVRVKCHNEYIVLNLHTEPELREYFTSFLKWQTFVSGPSNTHVINWEQWYLPNDESTSYIISPDCNVCEPTHNRQLYINRTVYMMTGTMFGCFWRFLGEHNFDEDLESQQCYFNPSYDTQQIHLNEMGELTPFELNDLSTKSDWDHSGVCAFNVRQSDFKILKRTHDMCTVDFSGESQFNMEMGYHLKPSIGIDGKYCVCTKPGNKRYYQVETSELHAAQERNKDFLIKQQQLDYKKMLEEKMEEYDIMNVPHDKITYLYQSDFLHGTYRIRESGIYIVMEDIMFDFNAGDVEDDPLNLDNWWPKADQQQIYPGAQSYRDPYFLGFWAGITIETNNVVLDLKGHSLSMSDAFYYKQRWFTTIALESQYFLPGQGPGFFGATPKFAKHVIIRNGVLGLSSHHNIHGHYNHDILIENIHCRDFETHGIQLNGFDGITLKNIEIGPSSTKVFLRGSFGHAVNLLPRLLQIADAMSDEHEEDKSIKFYGRDKAVSIQDIYDEMKLQLESVFQYVMSGNRNNKLTERKWQQILDTFYNPSGLPHGAGMYGIFLNTVGASVLTYNLQTSTYSNNAVLHDINIHDLQHSMIEFIRMGVPNSGSIVLNALHGCLDARDLLNDIDNIGEHGYIPSYKGNILTDATIAMEYFSNNWDLLQSSLIWHDRLFPWATGEDLYALKEFNIGCNGDAQVHAAKGLTGIRVDGVNNLQLKQININNLKEVTPPGTSLCGKYTSFDRDCIGKCGGHIRQKEPMQVGFSGHNLQGICLNAAKNVNVGKININNLQSLYGLTYGISIWPSVDIMFEQNVIIENLLAGVDYKNILPEDEMEEYGDMIIDEYGDNYPNRIPEVCGIRVVNEYYSDTADKIYKSTVKFKDGLQQNDILIANIDGYKTCYVDTRDDDYYDNGRPPKYSMIGTFKGHTSKFNGIGKFGTLYHQNNNKKRHSMNNFNIYINYWIISVVVFFIIIVIVIGIKKYGCSKSYHFDVMKKNIGSTLSVDDGGRIICVSSYNPELTPLLK